MNGIGNLGRGLTNFTSMFTVEEESKKEKRSV